MRLNRYALAPLALGLIAASSADARPKPAAPTSPAQHDASWAAHEKLQGESILRGLKWRSIGPTVQGGRVVDVEAIPGSPYGFYVAYATGGVWKTTNNGGSFEPLSDTLPTMVTGDIAVDPNNPQRLWIGSGEPNSSRSSYGGLGVFRSDDGGKTFTNVGLEDSDRIGRVVVDPRDGDHVCVAALGKLYSTGGSRGVFCTRDAGASWKQTLRNENDWTGAIDLVVDEKNPDVMYAATWERSRTPWNLVETGAGSGVYKSTDGGDSWARLGGGLPTGKNVGRIGLAIAPSDSNVVYVSVDNWDPLPKNLIDYGDRPITLKRLSGMSREEFLRQDPEEIEQFIRSSDLDTTLTAEQLIEEVKSNKTKVDDIVAKLRAKDTGFGAVDVWGLTVYRSGDAGKTFARTHEEPLREITYTFGYYFGQIRVSPANPDEVYVSGVPVARSTDGGRTFKSIQHRDVHVDYHAQWIDREDPNRFILGNDGGVDITYDGGKTFHKMDAQPLGQFYTVMVDMAEPYNVYGGLQDNGTLKGPSTARWWIGEEWAPIGGGDGMHVAVDTRDNATTYTGYQFGFYLRQGPAGRQEVRPREKIKDPALRYNWNTPVILSSHNQDVVYYGANQLFRSMNKGETWNAISQDLTSSKERGDVPFATITSVSESPLEFGLLWVGTDDGHVWLGRGNDRWVKVDDALPTDRWVSRVVASAHSKDRAYVSLNGYRNDDATPYVYVTDDGGKRWRSIASNLPFEAVNVVREDPVNADVLYVGTDRGVYASVDRGASWMAFDGGLPNVPVHDLIVHPRERELVAATHGRSVWIADALPVQEYATVKSKPVHVFPLSPVKASRDWRSAPARWFDETDYLPTVKVAFWSAKRGEAKVTVTDADKHVIRTFEADAIAGMNVAEWDVKVDRDLALAAEKASGTKGAGTPADSGRKADAMDSVAKQPYAESVRLGHHLFARPGKYTVAVEVDGQRHETALEITAPEAFTPRAKPQPKIRGRDKWSTPQAEPPPRPIGRTKTKPL